jgi:hypothetical protein
MSSRLTPRQTPTPTTTYPFSTTIYSTSLPSTTFKTPTAACMISNDRTVNDHAFWDLYACCKGLDITASGTDVTTENHFNTCSAQCSVGDEQTWQDLGECLSKRVEVVVCSPRWLEIGRNDTSSGTRSGTAGQSGTSVSGSASTSMAGQSSPSTGAAGMNAVAHVGGSKTGAVVFGLLAMGSFVGMML